MCGYTKSWLCDIPSDAVHGKQFVFDLVNHLEQLGWTDEDVFGVHLAAEEALANAIQHGNKNEHQRSLRIRCRASVRDVWLQIKDDGLGFSIEDIPRPTERDLDVQHGRGLMLMQQYMSTVEFNRRGNCVTMYKTRS